MNRERTGRPGQHLKSEDKQLRSTFYIMYTLPYNF